MDRSAEFGSSPQSWLDGAELQTNPAHWRTVAPTVASAFFMDNLDATVIVIALPIIAGSFRTEAAIFLVPFRSLG